MRKDGRPRGQQAGHRPRYVRAGDSGLYVYFDRVIDPGVNRRVRELAGRLRRAAPPGVQDIVPSYGAVFVRYDPLVTSFEEVAARCRALDAGPDDSEPPPPRVYLLPTVYGGEYGPDLEEVARYHGLAPEDVVRIHSSAAYYIYFLGFTPGFPFLGGLSPRLATPRREVPRTRVPAGSVGIGGSQTGVYPVSSPGGWHLIGRTPVPLFRADRQPPAVLEPGHYVRFVPVTEEEFRRIRAAVAAGEYEIETVPPEANGRTTGKGRRDGGGADSGRAGGN
ncbi:MAG TPA: 5-oxoprolinase subunit PxpB [Thermaerobacter sp.]